MSAIVGAQTTAKGQAQPRGKSVAYWATTVLLAFVAGSGGIGQLTQQWGTLETVKILGYPEYFLIILGVGKVLGAIAILVPSLPRLKEWAYAGIFFDLTGAAASHAFAGDYGGIAYHIWSTLGLALLALASWALRPQSRRL